MGKIPLLCILLAPIFLQAHNFEITSIHNLLKIHPEIEYIKYQDAQSFEYEPFPISRFPELQPNKGIFAETFILKIPNGQACSCKGWIKIDNNIIEELIPQQFSLESQKQLLKQTSFNDCQKIAGKVVVLTTLFDTIYCHWINHILCRLALVELQNIAYDYIYVACDKPYMKESLTLWGIDESKIIQPFGNNKYIQADELIVPSLIGIRIPQAHEYILNWVPLDQYSSTWNIPQQELFLGNNYFDNKTDIIPPHINIKNYFLRSTPLCSNYFCEPTLKYIHNKYISSLPANNHTFSKKVFISRKDYGGRQIINEDSIFSLFEEQGFAKYTLGNMSTADQITLFNNAEIIVAAHGSALVNIIFCKPNTNIIEIFQARSDSCFFYLSQILSLNHYCIKTMNFPDIIGAMDSEIPDHIIKDFIEKNKDLFNASKEKNV